MKWKDSFVSLHNAKQKLNWIPYISYGYETIDKGPISFDKTVHTHTHYVHSRTIPIVGLFVFPNIFFLLKTPHLIFCDIRTLAIITVDNRKYNMLSWKSAFVCAILYFSFFISFFFAKYSKYLHYWCEKYYV